MDWIMIAMVLLIIMRFVSQGISASQASASKRYASLGKSVHVRLRVQREHVKKALNLASLPQKAGGCASLVLRLRKYVMERMMIVTEL
jgi:hypothetical protein